MLDQKPQVNLSRPTALRMWLVFGCALGAILYSAVRDEFASLGLALSALAAALPAEALARHFGKLRGYSPRPSGPPPPDRAGYPGGFGLSPAAGPGARIADGRIADGRIADGRIADGRIADGRIADGSAAASALILVLLLPNTINWLYPVLGAVFAMLLVKYSFGGLGANWANPALSAWLFIRLSWPSLFAAGPGAFPGGSGGALDTAVRGFLNRTVFSVTGAELPPGYVDLFMGSQPGGIIADRGLPLVILGTILLTATQANRAWIPGLYLGLYALLVRVFGALPQGGGLGEGDVLYALLSGGTLAAAFFVISDPVTGAKTWPGMLVCSALGAVFAFLFRYPGAEHYGALPAAALVNALVPLIRALERRGRAGFFRFGPARPAAEART
jgi:electron transport complex protein RnfD